MVSGGRRQVRWSTREQSVHESARRLGISRCAPTRSRLASLFVINKRNSAMKNPNMNGYRGHALPSGPTRSGRRRWPTLAASLLLATGALAGVNTPGASAAPTPVAVTVNARAGLATVPDTALGVNHAIWDTNLGTNRDLRPAARGRREDAALPRRLVRRHLPLEGPHRARRLRRPEHRLRHLHGRGAAGRRPADDHRELRHRHAGRGRRLGAVRQRDQGLRREVLDDRQRELRQRPLRVGVGGRRPPRQERHPVREPGRRRTPTR